jgi:ribokinase
MARSIVVVGSINMDLMVRCARLPAPGETVLGEDFSVVPGGKGANQAVAAARLGAHVIMVGCVGSDAFGQRATDALAAEGIDVSQLVRLPGVATGVAMITVDQRGENTIALAPGANAALSVAQVEAARALIAGAALLVCQLETPLAAAGHAIALAHAHRVPVLLNPAPAQPLPPAWFAQIDLLIPNALEAIALAGKAAGEGAGKGAGKVSGEGAGKGANEVDPEVGGEGDGEGHGEAAAAAAGLRAAGARTVLVTLGARGVLRADDRGVARFAAPVVTPVDTTGAGDTFVGAFATAYAEGLPVDACVTFAQAAAAISVTRRGAQAAMPRRTELAADAGRPASVPGAAS